jgi:hypothetical protein
MSIYKDLCNIAKWLAYGREDSIQDFEISFLQDCNENVSCPLDTGYVSYEKSGWSLLLVILAVSLQLGYVSPVYLDSVKNISDSMIRYSRSISRVIPPK